MEQLIHSGLLAFHNVALVGCAAAPFYNRALVLKRAQYGPTLNYRLDKVVEDTLLGNAPYCMTFISVLWITGLSMPLNYYLFNDAMKDVSLIAAIAIFIKIASIFAMMTIMVIIFFRINPELKEIFSGFDENKKPEKENESKFFQLRARRKHLCEICLYFAILILVSSAFIGFA